MLSKTEQKEAIVVLRGFCQDFYVILMAYDRKVWGFDAVATYISSDENSLADQDTALVIDDEVNLLDLFDGIDSHRNCSEVRK